MSEFAERIVRAAMDGMIAADDSAYNYCDEHSVDGETGHFAHAAAVATLREVAKTTPSLAVLDKFADEIEGETVVNSE